MDSVKILISLIGNIAIHILEVIFLLIIIFTFKIEDIGQYGVIISFLTMFAFILTLGFAFTYLKMISEVKNTEDEAICNGTFLFFRFIQFSLFIILIFISIGFLTNINLGAFYFFFSGFILGSIGTQVFNLFFIRKKQIFKSIIPLIISLLTKLILLIIFNYFFVSSIFILGVIYFISNFIFFIVNIAFLKSSVFKIPNRKYIKKFLKFSYPLFLMVSLIQIVNNIDIIFINTWFSLEEVAYYYTAKQIYTFFFNILTSISLILLTIFSENVFENKNELNLDLIRKIHQFLNLIVVPLFFFILLYSTNIIIFFFGEEYKLTGLILSILSFNLLILSIDFGHDVQLKALGEFNFYSKKMIFQNLLTIVLIILFISPEFLALGGIGCALALVISYIVTLIIFRPIIYKKFGLGFYWGSIRNFFIMFLIYIIQLYINQQLSYPIYFIPIFVLFNLGLYFLFIYLLKGYSKEDIKLLYKLIRIKNMKQTILTEFKNDY